MSVFDKWAWIKRNWAYVIEEATPMGLIFVGGTALNTVIFKEYCASEDIDLYDPNAKGVGSAHEAECISELGRRLKAKGFEIKSKDERALWIGPNIKVEVFNDATPFKKIEKRKAGVDVLTFDMGTYAEMKMAALLCRMDYDARDLVDLFMIKKRAGAGLRFPERDCEAMESRFNERLQAIKTTKREDLLMFQTDDQIDDMPYGEFEKFRGWLHEWLSGFR